VFHSAGGVYDHLKAGDERRPEDERTVVRFAPPTPQPREDEACARDKPT